MTQHGESNGCRRVALAPGLTLIVLGSGGPRAAGRAAASYVIAIEGTPRYLVDAGPGAFARLGESGIPTEALDTILLTHLHVDHAGDLPGLIKSRDLSGNEPVRFRIVGPSGQGVYPSTSTFVDRLFGTQGAFAYLPAFENPVTIDARDVTFDLEREPVNVLDENGVKVFAASVDHRDVPALAYRIEYAGRSVVITGDLASKRGQIATLARGANVLVYDTAILESGSAPWLYALHTSPKRIGEVAAEAGVQRLLLSHIQPDVDKQQASVLAAVRSAFAGEVLFAHDCLSVRAAS
jgi:ribonuclease BN (tRNA processing enzyme)